MDMINEAFFLANNLFLTVNIRIHKYTGKFFPLTVNFDFIY